MDSRDIVQRLKAGTANRKPWHWPGTDVEVELRVLTDQDQLEAGLAADRLYRDAKIDVGMPNIQDYEAEKTTQLLFRAVLDPTTHKQLFGDIAEFRRILTKPVRDALGLALDELQQECSPPVDCMEQDEFDSLVAQVKKTPEATISSLSSISTLRKLCTYLAVPPANSPTDSGSGS
jgi:hypothetical protein